MSLKTIRTNKSKSLLEKTLDILKSKVHPVEKDKDKKKKDKDKISNHNK